MADLSVTTPDRTGTDISANVASGEEYGSFINTGRELLVVTNAAATASDITITTTKTIDGEDVDDKVITILANGKYLFGPFPTEIYNNGDNEVDIQIGSGYADVDLFVIQPS